MPSSKKVVLFIVEGPTDATALNPMLKRIFNNEQIHFHIARGDITSNWNNNKINILKKIAECVNIELYRTKFVAKDILKIIHLIDTDGAFIPDSAIKRNHRSNLIYKTDEITTKNPQQIINRNNGKKAILNVLHMTKEISIGKQLSRTHNCNYAIYYFSRNMEHILHNSMGKLSNDEKSDYADNFAIRYEHDHHSFIDFISKSNFAVAGGYDETWRFIFDGTNSLHRYSNFHLALEG